MLEWLLLGTSVTAHCVQDFRVEAERFSPVITQEINEGSLKALCIEKTDGLLNAYYSSAAKVLGGPGLIIFECGPYGCLTNASIHEIAHHIDDSSMYSQVKRRFSLDDTQEFFLSTKRLEELNESAKQIMLAQRTLYLCDLFKKLPYDAFLTSPDVHFFSDYSDCIFISDDSRKQISDASNVVITEYRQVYLQNNIFAPKATIFLPSLPDMTDFEERYLSIRNSFGNSFLSFLSNAPEPIYPPPHISSGMHDEKIEEQFAAAADSLINGYVGKVVWGPMQFTLNKELLDGFAEYEYNGVRIFADHVNRYRAMPEYREYWCSRGLAPEVHDGCDTSNDRK